MTWSRRPSGVFGSSMGLGSAGFMVWGRSPSIFYYHYDYSYFVVIIAIIIMIRDLLADRSMVIKSVKGLCTLHFTSKGPREPVGKCSEPGGSGMWGDSKNSK